MDLESPFPKKVIIVRLGKEEYIEKVISVKDQGDVLEVIKSSGTLALVSKNQVRGVLSTRPEKLEEKDVVEAKAVVARLHKAQAELPNESACSNEEIEKWEKEIALAQDYHAKQGKLQEEDRENKRLEGHREKLRLAQQKAETRAITSKKSVGTNEPTHAAKQELGKTTWPGLNSEKKTGKKFWANRCRRRIKVKTPFMLSSRGRIIGALIFFLRRRLLKELILRACVTHWETRKQLRF